MEQFAARLRKRPLVSRGAPPGVLPAFIRGLVNAQLHTVRIALLGMASGSGRAPYRRRICGVLVGVAPAFGILDSRSGSLAVCFAPRPHRARNVDFGGV